MRAIRNIGVTAFAIVWVLVLISPRHRRKVARRLAEARRFVSHRFVDEEARRSTSRAIDAWEDEGGAPNAFSSNE